MIANGIAHNRIGNMMEHYPAAPLIACPRIYRWTASRDPCLVDAFLAVYNRSLLFLDSNQVHPSARAVSIVFCHPHLIDLELKAL